MSKKQLGSIMLLFCIAAILVAGGWPADAGDLAPPPGPVTPTMRTMQELYDNLQSLQAGVANARTAVQSLPGSGTATHVIDQPGSYFLAGNITGESGKHGIQINAQNVTLDLNGFALVGVPGSLDGIHIPGGSGLNINISNGTIRNWSGDGVDAGTGDSSPQAIFLEGLRAVQNAGDGLATGSEVVVIGCRAALNMGGGIAVEGGSIVRDCVCRDNGGDGILATNDCWVAGNYVDDHCGSSGIRVIAGNTYVSNNVIGDVTTGIKVDSPDNLIIQNRVNNSNCGSHVPYDIVSGNAVGQVIDFTSGGQLGHGITSEMNLSF
ncbi:MAG: right-handed parallel beta-helix repeat-containing protein [Phycisphaerales bacterium]|nr:right-handed parallel beta-helix repeat-containing protein [Phycisphaerales bacterium]